VTVVAIHQPQYLPWTPYCDKADSCDVFVYLDNVQYQKNGLQNRNQIKTSQGAAWLTVPVRASLGQAINEIRIAGQHWQKKHIRAIEQSYARAPAIARFTMPHDAGGLPVQPLKTILEQSWDCLVDLNIAVTEWLFAQLGIQSQRVRASELGVSGAREDLIVAICKTLGATVYLSGQGAKAYQDAAKFRQQGIELRYQRYHNRPYRQCYPGFVPDLSALDLILNMGDEARAVMLAGRQP
jgi:hypothetical protein